MNRRALSVLLFAWIFLCCEAFAAETFWKAGVARTNITPTEPLWLSGYASRTNAADGKVTDLWVKVLALEDVNGHRAIILTSDLLGIPRGIYDHVTAAMKQQFNLAPKDILLTASHSHCTPVLSNALYDVYPIDDQQRAMIENYSAALETKIIDTTARALADLAPARLASGQGTTGFAVNRRNNREGNVSDLIQHGKLNGPVDHAVPVLSVCQTDGQLKAVLFGYACHNTTMDFTKWCGDYAGYAQIALEKSHPGATAMFFMGCGGDQNPLPRRTLTLAQRYGDMLASAVEEVLLAPPQPLPPRLATSMEMLPLDFGPAPSEADLQKLLHDKAPSYQRYAARLLAQMKAGKPFIRTYPYPVQAWRFGDKQTLITLGGEVVVDYALKFKKQYGNDTWVAGYANEVMTYIPSFRVLKEGRYEGGGAMIAYGIPALRWSDDIETRITAAVKRQVKLAK
jgi:neutral ceramidase